MAGTQESQAQQAPDHYAQSLCLHADTVSQSFSADRDNASESFLYIFWKKIFHNDLAIYMMPMVRV
jgi:hypothetical protein